MNMAIMGVIYATLILQHFFCTYIEIFYTPTSIQFKNALILKLMMVNEVCEVSKYFLSSVKIGNSAYHFFFISHKDEGNQFFS